MSILLNWEFIKARDARMQEKQKEYGGKDNPKNYKNMPYRDLLDRIDGTVKDLDLSYESEKLPFKKSPFTKTRKELLDAANLCQMLWERLGEEIDTDKQPD